MSSVHTTTGKRRGTPPAGERLTRQIVVSRAAELIEQHGLSAFSLRSLATDLGVRPSALYNHVAGLDALLTAVAADAVENFEFTDDDAQWSDWLRALAIDLRGWMLERPQVARLILQRAGSTTAGPELLNRVTGRLATSGVDPAVAHLAWHVVFTVVVGAVQQDLARRVSTDGTFEAVLDIAVGGLVGAAGQPTDPAIRGLLHGHGFAGNAARA